MMTCLPLFAFTCVAAEADALQKAVENLSSSTGYHFDVSSHPLPAPVSAHYQKDKPVHFKAGDFEIFRKGEVMVYKEGDQWHRSRTGTVSDPLRILSATAKVRTIRLPHEELMTIVRLKTEWKKTETKNRTVWSASIDETAAKAIAPATDRDLARSANVEITMNADGQIASYKIDIRVQGRRGNAEVDGTVLQAVSVADIGKVKLEVPEPALKALAGK